jgi:hypothetical protein
MQGVVNTRNHVGHHSLIKEFSPRTVSLSYFTWSSGHHLGRSIWEGRLGISSSVVLGLDCRHLVGKELNCQENEQCELKLLSTGCKLPVKVAGEIEGNNDSELLCTRTLFPQVTKYLCLFD